MFEQPPGEVDRFETFDALVAAYDKKIFNVIYRILGDYDEAADVTQETFISAYRGFDKFRGDAKVFTWLYQIALNQSRNRLRQRGRTREFEGASLDEPVGGDSDDQAGTRDVADLTNAPHIVVQDREMRAKVMAAVESLPPDYREVVVLRELHGMSYNDIASTTGLSLDNVKTRISRARTMLRRKLEHYYSGT